MIIKSLSSLEKVFAKVEPCAEEFTGFSMLKNERCSFQIAFCSDKDENVCAEVIGELKDKVKIFSVRDVPVKLAAYDSTDEFYLSKESGMYPDILFPSSEIKAKAGEWYSFWFEVIPDGLTGSRVIEIKIGECFTQVTVNILDAVLPEQSLIYTNWFHCDGICDYYNVKPFIDEFWRIFKNFAGVARDHGMNCILTPLFTPALDTKIGGERTTVQLIGVKKRGGKYLFDFSLLKKWVEICREIGIDNFEICHFFTQWGALHAPKIMATDSKGRYKQIFGWDTRTSSKEYDDFLEQLSVKLKKFISENNLDGHIYFHISDEPGEKSIPVFKKRDKLIRKIFDGYTFIDTICDYEFYSKCSTDIPIPDVNSVENFYGKVDNLWAYYCCGQGNMNEPNRFISMPSLRNRVLGLLLYRYDLKGFLHWGYNFYNTQLSLEHINPYEVTDAGEKFPSGDSFIVYPGDDGEAVCSLRIKVLNEGFQDLAALRMIESRLGREKTLNLIGEVDMHNYPHENEWILNLREKINKTIESNL